MCAIDLILFDCDGVLVDSERISARCVSEAFREVGYMVDEASVLERFLGLSDPTMCAIVENEMGRALPGGFLEGLQHRTLGAFERELRAIKGVEEVVDALSVPCCITSSSHPDRIRRCLEITSLHERLGHNIFSATMVDFGKPAPDLFLHAARTMNARPDRCLAIEDSVAGVRGAKAAGMKVFGFTGGSHVVSACQSPRLAAAGADRVYADMADLSGDLIGCLDGRSHPERTSLQQG